MLGKGQKRKWSEEGAEPPLAPPSSALFSISVSKLHQSLQRGEPDLRHLVLVANTLRRIQDEMEPPWASAPQQPPDRGAWLGSRDQGPCKRPPLLPPTLTPVDQLLLSGMDASAFTSILEEMTIADGFSDPLCPPTVEPEAPLPCESTSLEPGHPAQPDLGSLELLGPGGALLEEEAAGGLDSLFEDIDTSMYDCDPWAPAKEACSGGEADRQDLADLEYLLDALVGAEEL